MHYPHKISHCQEICFYSCLVTVGLQQSTTAMLYYTPAILWSILDTNASCRQKWDVGQKRYGHKCSTAAGLATFLLCSTHSGSSRVAHCDRARSSDFSAFLIALSLRFSSSRLRMSFSSCFTPESCQTSQLQATGSPPNTALNVITDTSVGNPCQRLHTSHRAASVTCGTMRIVRQHGCNKAPRFSLIT